MISKEDFANWRQDPVTKAFYEALNEQIELAKDELAINQENVYSDDWYKGYIVAVRDVVKFDLEEFQDA